MQNKPLASSEPEANSLGSILLKSTLQHRFSCSCKYNNITYSEELVKKNGINRLTKVMLISNLA